ncbi:hypothetical protein Goarm_019112 [Gossypium armourianum]|uniref:RNase H type-1 domain-containing protein n=1 Tax=Gossypium armourianum TaxID=34283 RepID=A0A7J9IL08_9ROSI|nr:hypothetical protein [Gossypium armourianum]
MHPQEDKLIWGGEHTGLYLCGKGDMGAARLCPCVKVNVVGGFDLGNRMSGSSILVRNNDKYVLRAWSHVSRNIPAPFATEGLACLEAVLFPNDMVFQHVVVEGDSQSIISKLGKTKLDGSKLKKVLDNEAVAFGLRKLSRLWRQF